MPSKNEEKTVKNGKISSIDPIYKKYTKSIIRSLASTEFYEFFMDMISHAENSFQFSNRKVVKSVDVVWVDAVEAALKALRNIIESPRNIIREEEIIVNIANAKKTNSDVVRHLSQHGSLIEDFDYKTGDVKPSKVMQKLRDDSSDIYENRLVFTTLENAYHFVKIRHDAIFEVMGDEFGANLKMQSDMESASETVHMDMNLHIKEKEGILETDEKNGNVFSRISRIYRVLAMFMNTPFAKELSKAPRVKGNVVKTNVLKKNPDYKGAVALYDFLRKYDDIGYAISVVEQNPVISETFQRDIYHGIMYNYIILKGYLEDAEDRKLPAPMREKKKTIKPKFIREIIEELTEDYDLPDVEIRKVLIEELTKEQLMKEEAEERRRLVEEQAQRKKAEAEKLRLEKEAEKERLRREKEAEKERIRQEKEAEAERLKKERIEREAEDRRRSLIFKKELQLFNDNFEKRLEEREAAEKRKLALEEKRRKEEEAARLLAEAEERRKEEKLRLEKKKQEEKEKLLFEKRAAEEAAKREKRRMEEEKRLEKLRIEAEKKAAEEKREREEAEKALSVFSDELAAFAVDISRRLDERKTLENERRLEEERLAEERRLRRKQKMIEAARK